MIILLLLAIGLSIAAPPKAECPPLPSSCACRADSSGRLIVSCNGANPNDVVKGLGALPIDRLEVRNCTQPSIDLFPKGPVRSISITECKVNKIDPKAFTQVASSLEELTLSENEISTIPLFPSMPKLISLNLNGNELADIDEKSLAGLSALRFFRLKGNKICNFSRNALSEVKSTLELLDLSGNCFSSVPAPNLRSSSKLMYLDLSDNKISEINNFELMNLPELRELKINNNRLSTVHPMAFMNVPQLRFLYLKYNLLGSLDGSKLQAFKQLEILDVSNNLLQKVPSLKDLPQLQQIKLDGNLIEKIETLTFSNDPRLKLISLQNNNINIIARNSFDGLENMLVLLLANNSIKNLERGMFDGMRHLQQLNLRNNTIAKLEPNSFSSLPHLTSLDLAHNDLHQIPAGTMANMTKLFWLDISSNHLQGFERGTFNEKLGNILLENNPLECDDKLDWFIRFLVVNKVRTFLAPQTEIVCAGPEQSKGMKLKDLMIKKANETMNEPRPQIQPANSILSSLLPGLGAAPVAGPSLRPIAQAPRPVAAPNGQALNAVLQKLANGQLSPTDIRQLIQAMPDMIVNVPGFGNVDLSKLDPTIIEHVLQGGQIPGMPKGAVEGIIQQLVQKLQLAASGVGTGSATQQGGPPRASPQQPSRIPIVSPNALPNLDVAPRPETEFAMKPLGVQTDSRSKPAFSMSPEMIELLQMLPAGYNISKIPAEVITSLSRGEVPDMKKLPRDLLEHFKHNTDRIAIMFGRAKTNASLEEIMSKLPKFEKPVLPTFSPYDINKLTSEMIHDEEMARKAAKMKLYTAIALGLVGAATIVILGIFAVYVKRQRQNRTTR